MDKKAYLQPVNFFQEKFVQSTGHHEVEASNNMLQLYTDCSNYTEKSTSLDLIKFQYT